MSREIGIDLGTSNVLIHLKGHGIILNEPAVVAIDRRTREIVATGHGAYEMIGRAPASLSIIRPIKKGVISDFDVTEAMLTAMLERLGVRSFFSKPNVLICSPARISDVERVSLVEVAERASSGRVFLEDEARVAAVGAGVDYFDPSSYMMIDIGGGTCDIAVISSGEIIVSETLKLAGDDFDAAIVQYFKEQHQLLIGERSAETIKKQLATAIEVSSAEMLTQAVKGRDLLTGLPKSINAHSNHLYEALKPLLEQIARVAKRVIEDLPPEIAADIAEKGVILTGGGALIYQLDTFLTKQMKVSVIRADQPLNCVGLGTGLMLDLILSGKLERTNPTLKQKFQRWLRRWRRRIIG